jgi:hypothetical protein
MKKLVCQKMDWWIENKNIKKVKVEQSRNRPDVVQSVAGGLGSQISMTFGT